ncbi:MAG: aspartyl protease family protein [Bacteroidota bacterium]
MRISSIIALFFGFAAYAQQPVASTSFEQYGDHIIIQLSVDDSKPLDFIFDTGAGLTVLDTDVAKELNLVFDHDENAEAAQSQIQSIAIKHNKIELNKYILESDIKLNAANLKHLEISIGRDIDGIIGFDLAHHHIVRLDYDNMKLEIYEGDYPKNGKAVSFKSHLGIPTINGSLRLNNNELIKGTFFVNTGAGTTIDFNTPFANKNDLIHKTGEHYSYLVKDISNNETLHYEGRVKMMEFDGFEFENLPIGISQVEQGIQANSHVSGIIGNKLLRKFNILFDYPKHKLYMEKAGSFEEVVEVNCSGMDVQMNEEMSAVLIHQIIKGGPADVAGIELNDELISINGKKAMDLTLVEIEKLLKKDRGTAELIVKRGGIEKTYSLKLNSLL